MARSKWLQNEIDTGISSSYARKMREIENLLTPYPTLVSVGVPFSELYYRIIHVLQFKERHSIGAARSYRDRELTAEQPRSARNSVVKSGKQRLCVRQSSFYSLEANSGQKSIRVNFRRPPFWTKLVLGLQTQSYHCVFVAMT